MIFVIVKTFEILVPDSRCKLFDQYRYCRLKQEYYVNWVSKTLASTDWFQTSPLSSPNACSWEVPFN